MGATFLFLKPERDESIGIRLPYNCSLSAVISSVWWQYLCGVVKKRDSENISLVNAFTWFIFVTLYKRGTVLWLILLHIWDVFSLLYQANVCIQQVNKFLCSTATEFIKPNMKCITMIPRIGYNMGCLDLHGSFSLSALVCLPVLEHLAHEREWLWFWLLNWGLDSCSSPSIQREVCFGPVKQNWIFGSCHLSWFTLKMDMAMLQDGRTRLQPSSSGRRM